MKTVQGETILQKLDRFRETAESSDEWIEKVKGTLSEGDRAAALREISIATRPNSNISVEQREAYKKLKPVLLTEILNAERAETERRIGQLRQNLQKIGIPNEKVQQIELELDSIQKLDKSIPSSEQNIEARRLGNEEINRWMGELEKQIKQEELFAKRVERQLNFYKRMTEKESVTTVLGSIILLILTFALVIGKFSNINQDWKIIENGFLILLGFFFGQQQSKKD